MAAVDAQDERQAAVRDRSFKVVRERGFYLRQAADGGDLKAVLREATEMLKELRTNELTPKFYYELYMEILNEMRYLENFFMGYANEGGGSAAEIYRKVQATQQIVPRLYLLVTAGSVVMRMGERPNHEVLQDLVQMCKGVQHPTRGLFLRNYLCISTRDKLPDAGSDPRLGTLEDAMSFVLQNFGETNRLWVRLQHQGAIQDKAKRTRMRQDLRQLVGQNIDRLSRLEGVGVGEYERVILPKLLEHVIKCRDVLAQSYIMDIIISVFPDDFHLATLTPFLAVVPQLKERVNVRTILEALMQRLALYVASGAEAGEARLPDGVDVFAALNDTINSVLEERSKIKLAEVLRLEASLLDFSMKCFPTRLDYVDHILGTTAQVIDAKRAQQAPEEELFGADAIEHVEHLLSVPLDRLALRVLDLARYGDLLSALPWENRRAVASALLRAVLADAAPIDSADKLDQLFLLLTPLLRDPTDEEAAGDASARAALRAAAQHAADRENGVQGAPDEAFEAEQLLVARVVHLLRAEAPSQLHAMFLKARRSFGLGGVRRIQHTLVPLVFRELALVRRLHAAEAQRAPAQPQAPAPTGGEEEGAGDGGGGAADAPAEAAPAGVPARKGFQFVHEIVTAMAPSYPALALRLFLQGAAAADGLSLSDIAYEFMTQAFTIYEEMLSDSRVQVRALQSMVGTMLQCAHFAEEDRDSIVTNLAQHCATLLKKPNQCRMVAMAGHLFWAGANRNGRRVLECLKRALMIADVCMASSANVHLFVGILDEYLYYFENDVPEITHTYLMGLIELISEHLENMEPGDARAAAQTHFTNTLDHIRRKRRQAETADKFAGIEV